MSLMFNPHPYNEPATINKPQISPQTVNSLKVGIASIVEEIAMKASKLGKPIIAFDSYQSVEFERLVDMVNCKLALTGKKCKVIDTSIYYRPHDEIDALLQPYLQRDLKKDPVLLFGKRVEDAYGVIFDADKLATVIGETENSETAFVRANIGKYFVENLGNMPVIVNKTCLKYGFEANRM